MRRKLLAVLMSAVCLVAAAVPSSVVFADGEKVVTLGADLSEDQKNAVLRYFGIAGQNLRTLTITNQDERNHLGSYVPLEQIGTRTYSCALVNPTTSGGIQVKTANLTWVTSNMIASTLSTSGVVNCEVLAAAPFEVSGTGALTGILMAYESAVGAPLDAAKKEVATQELVTTTTVANNIGQQQAANIVNETKIQVIQGRVVDEQQITDIVEEVADDQDVELSEDDRALITDLLEKIAEQEYDYEEMKDTLERVENNLDELTTQNANTQIDGAGTIDTTPEAPVNPEPETEPETLAQDSILMGTDDFALGDSVLIDATNKEAIPEDAQTLENTAPETQASADANGGIEIPPPTDVYMSPEADGNLNSEENPDGNDSEYNIPDGTTDVFPPAGEEGQEELPEDNQSDDSDSGNWFTDLFSPDDNTGDEEYEDGNEAGNEAPAEPDAPAEDAGNDSAEEEGGGWFSDLFSSDENSGDEAGNEADNGTGNEIPAETTAPAEEGTPEVPEEGTVTDTPEAPLVSIPLSDLHFVEVTSSETNFEPLPAGISELDICFVNGDYVPGTGTLTVSRESDGSVFDTVSMSDSSRVKVEPISSSGLLGRFGWETGYQLVVSLNSPLEANESFYVTFTEDILTSSDGTAHSEALEDPSGWCISTLADGLVLDKTSPFLTAGSTVTGHILMDAELGAVSASVSNVDPEIMSFDVTEFSSDAPDFNLTFSGTGTTTFTISYFDTEGNSIYMIDYTLTVR